ncbi:MAG TPA: hypothetical protein VMT00_11635 [Thermoanaerobaculia bacterium]|nr:hypothetical protein [Thermoanaerobaculia bacterium]
MTGSLPSSEVNPSEKVFLLSPANLSGARAKQLLSPRASFEAATLYRSPDGVAIDQAFSFMSALYFRGKIAYARRFAWAPELEDSAVYIIAPGFGLVPPDWRIDRVRMRTLRRTAVDLASRAYRRPLEAAAGALYARLAPSTHVVLLGSVATGKYVDVLRPILGDRLLFPRSFAGLGDMSRGSLMLRAAASGEELAYATLDAPRHRSS